MSDSARDRLRRLLGGKPPAPGAPTSPPAQHLKPLDKSPVPKSEPIIPARPAASFPQPAHSAAPVPRAAAGPSPLLERLAPPQPETRPAQRVEPEPLLEQPVAPPASEERPTLPDARLYLQDLRGKMAQVAEEFAQGKLNRSQFQEIYTHYQQQRAQVERMMYEMPGSDAWRGVVSTGLTSMLRQRNAAQILSYAIYDNLTSLPLASVGKFKVDTGLLVPMLSSFRAATQEIFGAGMRNTEIEGGRWLCFVPGRMTTLLVVFSVEPARIQLNLIEDLHRDFETAYGSMLSSGEGVEAAQQFVKLWALNQAVP